MEIIATENGWHVKGTSKILRAQGALREHLESSPEEFSAPFAQVLSIEGEPYVWLSVRPGAPDALPEEDQ